jgi:hypothetical protein
MFTKYKYELAALAFAPIFYGSLFLIMGVM